MRMKLPLFLLALALPLAPARAQGDDSPPPLTPEILGQLVECRGSGDDLFSYAGTLFGDTMPSWLQSVEDNGHSGMIGLWTYRLAQPIAVFGQKVDEVSFMKNWVVVEMPRDAALSVIRQQHMERAPIRITEQYYHFEDEEKGPMLGAFAPTDDSLEMAFGAPPKADEDHKTLFIGCNYSAVSKAEFLDGARQADAMFGQAGDDIKHMLKDGQ